MNPLQQSNPADFDRIRKLLDKMTKVGLIKEWGMTETGVAVHWTDDGRGTIAILRDLETDLGLKSVDDMVALFAIANIGRLKTKPR